MCLAKEILYMECKCSGIEIVEDCENVRKGGVCDDDIGIILLFTREMLRPSLCPKCYRRREEQIFSLSEDKLSWAAFRLNHLEGILEKVTADDEQSNIKNEIEELKRSRDRESRLRTTRLQAFRDSQGVWGDG